MNKTIIKNGAVAVGNTIQIIDIEISGGKITNIDTNLPCDGADIIDATGKTVLPGFIETHTHGANNIDMNLLDTDSLNRLSYFYASHGVTSFLATLLTDTKDKLAECIAFLGDSSDKELSGASMLGIHMEGPYLSVDYKGAMPPDFLQKPDVAEFEHYQKLAKGTIKQITVSPEVEGALDFIKEISKTGVVVSMGHSGADYDTTWQAIHNGAKCSTHTYNAMKLPHQHHPNIFGAVCESDIYSEVICDGLHVHPGNIRILLKIKSWDRVIAITDSISAAGLPDGTGYKLGANSITVTNGDAWLADGSCRAGSTLTSDRAFRNLLEFTHEPAELVIKLMTQNQARLMNIYDQKGSIAIGKDADITIWDDEYTLLSTIVNGKTVYKKEV